MKNLFYIRTCLCTLILCTVFLIICTSNSTAPNAGGETLNEKTVFLSDGSRAKMAKVEFSNDQMIIKEVITNSDGKFKVPSLPPDSYNVFIMKKEGNLAFSANQYPVYISSDTNTVQDDTLYNSGKMIGYIKVHPLHRAILSGMLVEVKGISFETTPDSSGRFEIDDVPKNSSFRIKITPPWESGYNPKVLTITNDSSNVYWIDTIFLDYTGIPVIDSLSVSYDTFNGVAKLNWEKSHYDNILEYVIIREQIEKTNGPVVSFLDDTIPSFNDTLFSSSPKSWQHSLFDTSSYTYRYSVVIKNNSLITGDPYVNPVNTFTVFSPLKTKAGFQFQIIDSVSSDLVQSVPVNKTVAIVTTISSNYVPFSIINIQDENGKIFNKVLGEPVKEFKDTLFWKDSTYGLKHFTYKVGTQTGFRDFDMAVCSFMVNDINLIVDKVELLSPPINNRPLYLKVHIKNSGVSIVPSNSNLDISYFLDSKQEIRNIHIIDSLKPGESVECVLDSAQTSDSSWIMTTGFHTINIVLNKNGVIRESNISDNTSIHKIFFSNVDLAISSIDLCPADVIPGDLVSFGAWVVNKGTTVNDSTVPVLVSFKFGDTALSQSIVYRKVAPGDSVMVQSTLRKAQNGENHITAIIEHNKFMNRAVPSEPQYDSCGTYEINVENNTFESVQIIKMPEYLDLAIESFNVDSMSRNTGISISLSMQNIGNIIFINNVNLEIELIFNEIFSKVIKLPYFGLAAGTTITFYRDFTDSATLDFISNNDTSYTVTAKIDPQNLIKESNKDNNSVSTKFVCDEIFVNGNFEQNVVLDTSLNIINKWYPRWEYINGKTEFRWEVGMGMNKSKCISIEFKDTCNDAYWTYNMQNVMKPGDKYRLSGWVKGEDIQICQDTFGANLCIDNSGYDNTSRVLTGTFNWTYIEMLYTVPDPIPEQFVGIACRLGFYYAIVKGKAYFDNIKLERVR